MIRRFLEDLERRLDPAVEAGLFEQWKAFADGQITDQIFSPTRAKSVPPSVAWPTVRVNDALDDFDRMALQQLGGCSQALAEGSGALLAVRCNYGTAILPSLFGAEMFLMDRELDTLPTCRPLAGGKGTIKRLLDAGVPELTGGQGAKVFEMGAHYRRLLAEFPVLSKHVHVYHPDLQGPMNVCEMLWGGSLYVDLYDEPDLIKDFLSLITETYVRFMHKWDKVVPPLDGYGVHWSMLHRGHIMVRDDAATNLSPAMFDEFVRPYDQRLMNEFGGGGIHFCGKGDHFIAGAVEVPGVYAINLTQPHLNDVETVFRQTVDRGVRLIGFEREIAQCALERGRDLHANVHCW